MVYTVNLIGNFGGIWKWAGCALLPNGKLYGIPYNLTQILEFDPDTHLTNLSENKQEDSHLFRWEMNC